MTKKDLENFTNEIANLFEQAKIKAPVHLSKGNERKLMILFDNLNITKKDWIFTTYRSHFHWLLSERNSEELKKQILEGHSMHVYDKRFFTSAIVGGIAPIALGVAYALKRKKSKRRVFCFLGDMAASGGLFKECLQYAEGHDLPILYIIENNDLSVKTNTKDSWGRNKKKKVIKYKYKRELPHMGTGKWVLF